MVPPSKCSWCGAVQTACVISAGLFAPDKRTRSARARARVCDEHAPRRDIIVVAFSALERACCNYRAGLCYVSICSHVASTSIGSSDSAAAVPQALSIAASIAALSAQPPRLPAAMNSALRGSIESPSLAACAAPTM